jgi:hypothetical protein
MPSKKVMWAEIADWFYLFISGKRKYVSIPENETRMINKISINLLKPLYEN